VSGLDRARSLATDKQELENKEEKLKFMAGHNRQEFL